MNYLNNMTKHKVCIVGSFGGNNFFVDGQTVKTKILFNELSKNENLEVTCVDTYYNRVNKLKLLWDSVRCILHSDIIILLVSGNGMRVYFPMLYYAKKILGIRIFHDVIGGNLDEYVRRYSAYTKYLNSFDGNWVEFDALKKRLEDLGVNNCCVIPNFKRLNTGAAKLDLTERGKRSFCMFSRVIREKGIVTAIEAVRRYNAEHDEKIYLHIWGPIDDGFREDFHQLLEENQDYVIYGGKVNFDKSVEALTDHLALLFPTFWRGEGFPGTVVDAFASGLPVIASDWNANKELIENFKTGIVYPVDGIADLYSAIEWAMDNSDKLIAMRKNCLQEVLKYSPDVQMKVINAMIMGE